MSRDQAPNYRQHSCCFYCTYAEIDLPYDRNYHGHCTYHAFYFVEGEARARICDDFEEWRNTGKEGK